MHCGREVMIIASQEQHAWRYTSDKYNSRLVMRDFYRATHVVIRDL